MVVPGAVVHEDNEMRWKMVRTRGAASLSRFHVNKGEKESADASAHDLKEHHFFTIREK